MSYLCLSLAFTVTKEKPSKGLINTLSIGCLRLADSCFFVILIFIVDRDGGGLKCARSVLNNKNLICNNISNYRHVNDNNYLLMIPSIGIKDKWVIEDYFPKSVHIQLTKTKIDEYGDDTEKLFLDFPKVKDDLKREYLPKFCIERATYTDMHNFKILLNEIKAILHL